VAAVFEIHGRKIMTEEGSSEEPLASHAELSDL